ncbi:MAG: tRNA-dihydrouridine synthase 3 [Sclerophora amabilis]|nr:MAG: tRNA-dihydrouridine synthase 3 [Sclerophora amabilis]
MASVNPLEPSSSLEAPPPHTQLEEAHPPQPPFPEDSAVTKAEKVERNGLLEVATPSEGMEEPSAKKRKLESPKSPAAPAPAESVARDTQKGMAPIKPEFLVHPSSRRNQSDNPAQDDDAAEASHHVDRGHHGTRDKKGKKAKGQNTSRNFGSSRDSIELCTTRVSYPEFSPRECRFGDNCRLEHNIRTYLEKGKREDLTTFNGKCPVWEARGKCGLGWKCRFLGSHMEEVILEDGRKELRLLEDHGKLAKRSGADEDGVGVLNLVGTEPKVRLMKKKFKTDKSDAYANWLETNAKELEVYLHSGKKKVDVASEEGETKINHSDATNDVQENRARYTEPPFLPSEKRRIYFGPETPTLAPLTTQGNLPFRRLCVELGAQATYSEMAMSLPLISGAKAEWALMKAHETETSPPAFGGRGTIVNGYDNAKDFKFGAQIAANKPWQALKTAEILTSLCPHLRVIDLNCGCPIDMVYRAGAGAALLDNHAKLEKLLRGMNAVSGEVPISAKIRLGTLAGRPTALKLAQRLVHGGLEANEIGGGPPGVAAITLHGRSRQQRYTKSADWSYIAECSALIKRLNLERNDLADTIREPDSRQLNSGADGHVYFLGNGDCYSHTDYFTNLQEAKVDSVMIARGALIKPWIFEEIDANQHLDKSASERLAYVEKFAKYGLEVWGSDEMGIGTTRRFLLEWLSFAHRYVPVGMLERLPPNIQDRPPAWKGRNELETLLGSENFRDWIKISEMFLGPAHKDFNFVPKHKSNSYEIEAEG